MEEIEEEEKTNEDTEMEEENLIDQDQNNENLEKEGLAIMLLIKQYVL